MQTTISITPHPNGDWVVSSKYSNLAVPPNLGRALFHLHGRSPEKSEILSALRKWINKENEAEISLAEAEALASILTAKEPLAGRTKILPSLWFRIPLIPGAIVRKMASHLKGLTSWPALGLAFLVGIAGYSVPGVIQNPELSQASIGFSYPFQVYPLALFLFLLSALWHELGHAAALARHGYPPGGIGAGLLFIIPVFYADVTHVGALSASGKARVDIAGVCFQIAFAGLMFATGSLWPGPGKLPGMVLRTAGTFALAAVVWSMIPFIKSDGYWLLADLLGVHNLERPLIGIGRWSTTIIVVAYRLLNVVFLMLVGRMIALRISGTWDYLARWLKLHFDSLMVNAGIKAMLMALVAIVGLGFLRRVTAMARASWVDIARQFENYDSTKKSKK